MKISEIFDDNKVNSTLSIEFENIEFTDPQKYVKKMFLDETLFGLDLFYREKLANLPTIESFMIKYNKALELWNEELTKINQSALPEYIKILLSTDNKKQSQEKLLKNAKFSINELNMLIYKAGRDYGFKYSYYKFENNKSEFKDKKFPKLMQLVGDEVKTVGNTDLTSGQMKQLIKNRKIVYAHIFDKDNAWHALLSNFMNVTGKESWNNRTPHYHYISDKWGISREKLITTLQNGEHPTSSIHIQLVDVMK